MKTTVQILLLACVVWLSSCKKSDDVQPSTNNTQIADQIWKVGYFGDSGKDETHKFTGYTFRFLENSKISIDSPEGKFEGSWNMTGNSGSGRFYINTSGNYQLTEINDDWLIVESSSTILWLGDDNPESAETLKFVRQ